MSPQRGAVRPVQQAPVSPTSRPPAAPQVAEPDPTTAWAFVIGLITPLLVAMLFWTGHDAVDQGQPDAAAAQLWYGACFVVAIGTGVGAWAVSRGHSTTVLAWGLGLAALPAFWTGAMGEEYGFGGFFAAFWFFGAFSIGYIALGVTAAVMAGIHGAASAARAALAGGVALAVGIGAAALYHLMTLDRQVAAARATHESPGVELFFLAAVLAGLAWRKMRVE